MASPSKRLRKSPLRPSFPATLESSTPQSGERRSMITSLQISCIQASSSGESVSSRSLSLRSSNSSNALFRDESESDSVIDSKASRQDYETYFQDMRRIKYSGKIWNLHKPLVEGSLYGEVLANPAGAKEHVKNLYSLYQQNRKKATVRLAQFTVDVAGFQKFDLSKIAGLDFGKDVTDRMKAIKVLREQDSLKKTGRCILQERGILAKHFQMGIYHFIDTLVMMGYENRVLFDKVLFQKFLTLVKHMAESNLAPVKYTGTAFTLKVLTAGVKLYARVCEEIDGVTDSEYDLVDDLMQAQSNVDDLVSFMYLVFIRRCGISDNKLMVLAIECVHEIKIWVNYFPKRFISDFDILKHLKALSLNPSIAVRHEAVVVCEYFVSTPHIWKHLQPVKDDFFRFVSDRFYDVDIKVTVKAVDVFIALLQYPLCGTKEDWMSDMLSLVFDKHFPTASAACKFWSAFFKIDSNDPERILLELIKLTTMPQIYAKELVVEGFLPHCSVLRSWELYVDFLMDDHSDIDTNAIAALFSEVLRQILTGKPTMPRVKSITEPAEVGFVEHARICELLPHFNKILLKYKQNPAILKDILKVIPALNPVLLSSSYAKDCITMWNIIQDLYTYHSDEALLEALIDALFFFHTAVNFSARAVRFTADFNQLFTDRLDSYFDNPTEEGLNDAPLKVAVLYPRTDLNETIKWQKLFVQLTNSTDEITGHLVQCCTWYLLWDLKKITKVPLNNVEQLTYIHKKRLDGLLREILSVIQKLNGNDLHYKVYSQLCEFLLKYEMELKEARKFAKILDILKIDLESDHVKVLQHFLDKYVIYKKEVTVEDKQKYFVDYINLGKMGVMSADNFAFAYKYYLKFNEEFGAIIDKSIDMNAQSPSKINILFIICYTMIYVYEAILKKFTLVPTNVDEFRDLRMLAKRLLCHKLFRKPAPHFVNMSFISIRYAFQDVSHLEFLYIARYFIDLLHDKESKITVQEFFNESKTEEAAKNDAAIYFWNYLKSLNVQENVNETTTLLNSLTIQGKETAKSKERSKTSAKTKPKEKVKAKEKAKPEEKAKPKGKNTPSEGAGASPKAARKKILAIARKSTPSSDSTLAEYSIHDSTSDDMELLSD
ncbi:unnamed protein product [Acanthoscelides obtectus]|uniref:STAG domain-containing protein n=1 Tax=Acanthoscelides obtectus TaxID=200917 RepID=A0A9P0PD79_ACAOB|nr:unnamed protein product [Acanthoscelides obtectus]CAK1660567.1 Cohesin subunit SA-2 [Acanthoscelides obtectus]